MSRKQSKRARFYAKQKLIRRKRRVWRRITQVKIPAGVMGPSDELVLTTTRSEDAALSFAWFVRTQNQIRERLGISDYFRQN